MTRKLYYLLAGGLVLLVLIFIINGAVRRDDGSAGSLPRSDRGGASAGPGPEENHGPLKRSDRGGAGEVDRRRAAELAAMVEAQRLEARNTVYEIPLSGLDVEGNLSPQAVKMLDLTQKEAREVADVIQAAKQEERESFVARARRTAGSDGVVKYTVRAKEDEGAGSKERLTERIKNAIGEDKGGRLASAVGESDLYGGFGKYDVDLEYYQENGETHVRFKYLRASDGQVGRYGGGSLKDINYTKWNIFPAGG